MKLKQTNKIHSWAVRIAQCLSICIHYLAVTALKVVHNN